MILPVTSSITSTIPQALLDMILFNIFISQDEGIDSIFNKLLTVSDRAQEQADQRSCSFLL